MTLDEQLGPFTGKFIDEVDPATVQPSEQTHYELWVTKECGHQLLFGDPSATPEYIHRHVQRLTELKDTSATRVIEQMRARYRRLVDRRLDDLRRFREQNPLDDFMAGYAQCYEAATRIVASLEDHLGIAPEEVTWKHVAEVGDAKKYLDSAAYLLRIRGPVDYLRPR